MRSTISLGFLLAAAIFPACSSASSSNSQTPPTGTPDGGSTTADGATAPAKRATEIGKGDGTPSSVTLTEIAGPGARLSKPTDLEFNPRVPTDLWVINYETNSTVIVHDANGDSPTTEYRRDNGAPHFMHKPTGIAFGADETTFGIPGTFATCGDSRNENGTVIEGGNDFMGPVLWSSDLTIYAKKDPKGLGSHIDMLHNTPLCMGISHVEKNIYWVYSGLNQALHWYDFRTDHNVGQDDHSDSASLEYVKGQVGHTPGVPSHVFYRAADAMLYVADTGNSRIAKLDTTTGTKGERLDTMEVQKGGHFRMNDAVLTDVVPTAKKLLSRPSGIEIKGDFIYVSDNETSHIKAFTLDGELVNDLDTGLPTGSLSGMTFDAKGRIYVVDMLGNRVLRIDPN